MEIFSSNIILVCHRKCYFLINIKKNSEFYNDGANKYTNRNEFSSTNPSTCIMYKNENLPKET